MLPILGQRISFWSSPYPLFSSLSFFLHFLHFCACWGYFSISIVFFCFFSVAGEGFCLIQQRHHPAITHEMLRDCETRSFPSFRRRPTSYTQQDRRVSQHKSGYIQTGRERKEGRKKERRNHRQRRRYSHI